ncbi:MAG: hypothetical protein KF844_06315 [Cryobacterium sp.]|nr:hypothetical protein [Cryobacterium sp.]
MLVALAFSVTGCSASQSSESEVWLPSSVSEALQIAKDHDLKFETSVLQDGVISSNEFEKAFDQYMDCAGELGYVFEPKYLDPVEGQLWRSIGTYEGAGEEPINAEQECENRLSLIEAPYVLTTPKRMDPKLLSAFEECLTVKGISFTGNEVNFNDFAENDQSTSLGGSKFGCLQESMSKVFPDVVGYGISANG